MKTTKEKIAVMQAFEDGKKVEIKGPLGKWIPCPSPIWAWNSCDYRISTEPKLRPWKPEEVPVGAVIRKKADPSIEAMITGKRNGAVLFGLLYNAEMAEHFSDHARDSLLYEYSLDHGKTWQPCGVLE